jgi:phosphate transport system permease protein
MFGVSMFAAAVVLMIMILPFIVAISYEALRAVPREQREAALALGATRWEATWRVVVPYAKLGLLSSVFLSFARAVGETMAVTMVIGNDPSISASLFAPGYTIAAVIANEFMEAGSELHVSALMELALVLLLITAIVNGSARMLVAGVAKEGRRWG